ncbi:MAG: PhzF family phenazine biosynthesis protein [Bacteroidota bacterium]
MKTSYNIFQIDAFTSTPFLGNPAAVTFGPNLSDEQMQLIAREMNLSETAFITASETADYKLRWFTPLVEVNLCGHATIASLHYLNELGKINNRNRITFETRSGILNCPVAENEYFMQIPLMNSKEFDLPVDLASRMLNTAAEYISGKYPFLLMDNGYLYIYCSSLQRLKEMAPDFNLVSEAGRKYNFDSVCVFSDETFDSENSAHSRFFAPLYGINEDPVTGSANGPLMLVLERLGIVDKDDKLIVRIFEQGDIIGRAGRIKVSHNLETNELYIGGSAVTILKGELFL